MALTFSYGDYSFDPKPLFSFSKEYIKTASNVGLGTVYTVSLQGQIIPQTGKIPSGGPTAGVNQVFSGVNDLRKAFDQDFKLLKLHCSGSDPIISGFPKITSLDIDHASDNYVVMANYNITLELPALTGTSFNNVGMTGACQPGAFNCTSPDLSSYGIVSYSDDFTVEFLNERQGGYLSLDLGTLPPIFSIQRNISAQGAALAGGTGAYRQPWERARDFVATQVGVQPDFTGLYGLMCPNYGNVSNNYRATSINKTEGSVNVTETYIALTGGSGYEDFEITVNRSLDDPFVGVTINGTVQGIASVAYPDPTSGSSGCPLPSGVDDPNTVPKFNGAILTWSGIVGSLYSRANNVYLVSAKSSGNPTAPYLNPTTLSETVGYNPIGGTVNYNYSYDDRPLNCYTGAITENIRFTENEPQDIFASLTILGKTSGPLLQAINTVGARTRELSIDAKLPVVPSCSATSFNTPPDVYDAMVLNYVAFLQSSYTQVFVNSASKTWEPKTGRFSANYSYTVGSC
jgi:hypothetical protein